jgi:hypothetical protein
MMEAIRIGIEQNAYGNLFATAGRTTLFRFRQDNVTGPQWRFYPEGEYQPVIFAGEEFPKEYFENLCKAKYFIEMHVDRYPESVQVVKGKNLLKWSLK